MVTLNPEKIVTIRYTNYRGETGIRRIIPIEIRFIATQWHPEAQWVMEAYDVEKGGQRSFAIKDILDWNVSAHTNGTVNSAT